MTVIAYHVKRLVAQRIMIKQHKSQTAPCPPILCDCLLLCFHMKTVAVVVVMNCMETRLYRGTICSSSATHSPTCISRFITVLLLSFMLSYRFISVLYSVLCYTYSMKQPDLYYFEAIKMTTQAWPNFVWRMRAASEYSL